MTIINSVTLEDEVAPLMSKGQFGARDVHKHLWKIPIPEFDDAILLHQDLAHLGQRLAEEAKVSGPRLKRPDQRTARAHR